MAPWMDIARAEIGVSETPGSGTTPRIREYHQHTSLRARDDETSWCAASVNWVLDKAGCPANHKANARSFLELTDWACDVKPGAIAIFWRERPTSWKGHVGFIDRIEGNTIYVLGGNQGDAVSIAPYPRTRLLGCRWPEPAPAAPGK